MRLVRVGDKILNLDLLIRADFAEKENGESKRPSLTLWFAVPDDTGESEPGPYIVYLWDAGASGLWKALCAQEVSLVVIGG
jgi:hypothetical protein